MAEEWTPVPSFHRALFENVHSYPIVMVERIFKHTHVHYCKCKVYLIVVQLPKFEGEKVMGLISSDTLFFTQVALVSYNKETRQTQ